VFGRMVGKERQGWAIFVVMGILFLAGMFTDIRRMMSLLSPHRPN